MKNEIEKSKDLERIKSEFAYRLFYPSVPVIICSKSGSTVAAMPASSFISVSNKPPMVALSLQKELRTTKVIKSSKIFSANWLNYKTENQRKYIIKLTKPSIQASADKLRENRIPYTVEQGGPMLLEAEANLLCSVRQVIDCGDHNLFIAKIQRTKASRDFLSRYYWEFKEYKPIIYLGSIKKPPILTLGR